jgi:hypothetical protein
VKSFLIICCSSRGFIAYMKKNHSSMYLKHSKGLHVYPKKLFS